MPAWTTEELDAFGAADEIRISAADDGAWSRPVPIWVVRVGDDLYVRSYKGRAGLWYQHLARSRQGRISVGDLEREVAADVPGDDVTAAVDRAYAEKYAHHGDSYVQAMTAPDVVATTLRLERR